MSEISPEQQSGWAGDIISALQDSALSTGTVVSWLRGNLGRLNVALRTEFNTSGEYIVPEMYDLQSGIYNEMYYCYWLRRKSQVMVGSMNYDWIEMEGEDQGRVRRVSNTQKGTTYQSMARDCETNLKELIKEYKGGDFAIPKQITFNCRESVPKDIPWDNFSFYNPLNCDCESE
jgi:hypothetical protein